jgi:hypothetical protein
MIGVGLTAAGSAYNAKVQQNYINSVNQQQKETMDRQIAASTEERRRQQRLEAERLALLDAAQGDTREAMSVERVAERAPKMGFEGIPEQTSVPYLQGQNAGASTASDIGKIIGDAVQRARGEVEARSRLASGREGMNDLGIRLTRMAQDTSAVGGYQDGSLSAYRTEKAVPPAEVRKSDSVLGDSLLLGGRLVAGRGGSFGGGGQNWWDI